MSLASARRRYVSDAVSTVTPAKLLVMLYDRLVLDLTRGQAAIAEGDLATANEQLTHAQQIVLELASSLRPEQWAGGPALAQLYEFLDRELVAANVAKDPARVQACIGLVRPLAEAWRHAAEQVGEPAVPTAAPAVRAAG